MEFLLRKTPVYFLMNAPNSDIKRLEPEIDLNNI
jgi:hypothetical protein